MNDANHSIGPDRGKAGVDTDAIGIIICGPKAIRCLEGGALMTASLVGYAMVGANWWLFAVLFLAPELFMLGYLIGPRLGASLYNIGIRRCRRRS